MFHYRVVCVLYLCVVYVHGKICTEKFCKDYKKKEVCVPPPEQCRGNSTDTGEWMPSPSPCNCCPYCMPVYGMNDTCSLGGYGSGQTVGRCGDGLQCKDVNGEAVCQRMKSKCHDDQDAYDISYLKGEVGMLQEKPRCDGKGKYSAFECVATQTCFCRSENGEKLFGEVPNLETSKKTMHCGCSRLHDKMQKLLGPILRFPFIGPRCTNDGNFGLVQCIDKKCYCVNPITGIIDNQESFINLDNQPASSLPCYEKSKDLYSKSTRSGPPYKYSTPCLNEMKGKIDKILQGEKDGYNMSFYNEVDDCLPDGSYKRVKILKNKMKICIDERGHRIESYGSDPNSPHYKSMNCNCAYTSLIMTKTQEKPVCCKNGNFRAVQSRRGKFYCVDADGMQKGMENSDIKALHCYKDNWKLC